jgi:hypothetical protein
MVMPLFTHGEYMKYAIIENGVVANIAASESALAENWIQSNTAKIGDTYSNGVFTTPPPAPAPVPESVTRRQAKQALLINGKLSLVQPAIDAIPDPAQKAMIQIEWDDSQEFQRSRSTVIAIGTAIGLDSAQLDDLFRQAVLL